MPTTTIEVRRSYSNEQEIEIIEAVQAALVDGFKIPPGDRCIRLIAYEPHRFIAPSRLDQPELYTVITISAFSGRSLEAKRSLYKGIVDRLAAIGIPPDHVKTLINEIPRENWGLRGGIPASEIELDFKVDV